MPLGSRTKLPENISLQSIGDYIPPQCILMNLREVRAHEEKSFRNRISCGTDRGPAGCKEAIE
jgi:hypothetical protein